TAGDGALIEIAQRIRHFAGDELESGVWIAARSSGDTFLLALREECNRERWQWLAEALADAIAMPIGDPDTGHSLRLWPRVALIRAVAGDTAGSLLDTLSEASVRIRSLQGHRVVWTSGELAKDGRSSQQLEADLLAAIDRDEISIRFQPQYSLETDLLIGAEALARWDHPMLGRVGAATLFTIAERADHTAQLSRHIASKALAAARAWPEGLRLSINVTPADLAAGSFAREFLALVAASGIDPHSLTLEITEQVLLADLEQVSAVLDELKANGISLSLDDFGAGFCNFRYLKVLPIDHLKLDRSMIEGVLEDARDLAVFRAIVAMAKALDLKVVVEGVETEAQRALIAREGCEVYQGFLRAEPMPAEEFLALAAR
ncbi:MAG: GGDEF domain-containing phosphodiesterase, partial [Alphaproteobacteria bacterium]|nr:GGDEF domain-containing phosphodiesterase [Alphaproteobacteria bacterium]